MKNENETLLIAAPLARKELLGGISAMTEWRWSHDPEMDFPRPIVINRRKYFRRADLLSWLETRAQEAA